MPHATDRAGNEPPSAPTAAELEQLADRLRVVPDAELPVGVVDRFAPDDLEERRRQAIGQ